MTFVVAEKPHDSRSPDFDGPYMTAGEVEHYQYRERMYQIKGELEETANYASGLAETFKHMSDLIVELSKNSHATTDHRFERLKEFIEKNHFLINTISDELNIFHLLYSKNYKDPTVHS